VLHTVLHTAADSLLPPMKLLLSCPIPTLPLPLNVMKLMLSATFYPHLSRPHVPTTSSAVIVAWVLLVALIIYLIQYNSVRNDAGASQTVVNALGKHHRLVMRLLLGQEK